MRYRGIPKDVKDAVRARAGGFCENCGRLPDWRGLEFSHKLHRGMGGRKGIMRAIIDSEENVDHLCAPCHERRDDPGKKGVHNCDISGVFGKFRPITQGKAERSVF